MKTSFSIPLLIIVVWISSSFLLRVASGQQEAGQPSIEFTSVPFVDKGGPDMLANIEGRVIGAKPGQRIVLYARSRSWYVQPFVDQPFTTLHSDSTWRNSTHLGTEYAAILVEPDFVPASVMETLPLTGGGIVAIKNVPGTPYFWQTWWFRLLLGLAGLAVILLLIRWRHRRLVRELNLRFEQRLAERNRIAQDLHDTLLQGLLSASMQLHVADEQISADSPAKPLVRRVLELMGQVIDEGRNAVSGLRSQHTDVMELEQSFSRIQQELRLVQKVDYILTVEGISRPLRPIIRDEVYRVGHEALINAFRHSNSTRVEVEILYTPKALKLLVRDNGIGMDTGVLHEGREGHWGLSGMRERANEIGGKLNVWSRVGAGTEVELTIPSQIAFESNGSSRQWLTRWFPWKSMSTVQKSDRAK